MHKKKYFILLIPAILVFAFLLYYLPTGSKQYSIIVPLVFWIVYYIWVGIEKKTSSSNR